MRRRNARLMSAKRLSAKQSHDEPEDARHFGTHTIRPIGHYASSTHRRRVHSPVTTDLLTYLLSGNFAWCISLRCVSCVTILCKVLALLALRVLRYAGNRPLRSTLTSYRVFTRESLDGETVACVE